MGCDCKLELPAPAKLTDVADVIGMLLGQHSHIEMISSVVKSVRVEGVHTTPSAIPSCAQIQINTVTDKEPRWFLYHFEYGGGPDHANDTRGSRGIIFRCTADNIALAVGLATFFGGQVDFNDSDDSDVDFKRKTQKDIGAQDGDLWDSFQERKAAVSAIGPKQVKKYEKYAAY